MAVGMSKGLEAISAVSATAPLKNDRSGAAPHGQQSELREAARQFEALFVKQLLSQVNIAGGIGGEENAQSDFINSQWRDQIADQMSQGAGLGLAQMLVRQMGGTPDNAAGSLNRGAPVAISHSGPATPSRPLISLQDKVNALFDEFSAEPPRFSDRQEFVSKLKPHLQAAAEDLGISPKILLAQAALETGWGRHMPSDASGQSSRNLFGIKADRAWQGPAVSSQTAEFRQGQFVSEEAGFRQYPSFADSVRDYVDFLRSNPRYEQALQHGGDDKNFLQGLKSAGYATDPQYVEKVIDVADSPAMQRYWNSI